jgi:hypothetical protein
MYRHKLYVLQQEIVPDVEFDDSVYKHIVYAYVTNKLNIDSSIDSTYVHKDVVYLDDPVIDNFVPSNEVTKELLEQWVTEKIDIESIQNNNILELNK